MAIIIRSGEREFKENQGKIEGFRIFTDMSRERKGVRPEHLNFDVRRLDPGQYSAPYHFHRHAEELFVMISGAATLRSPEGLEVVVAGDIMFFGAGEGGAHQLYNHTDEPCEFLDIRTYLGYDLCEYPDSDKILVAPSMEVFRKGDRTGYFEGEEDPGKKWEGLRERSGRNDIK